MKMTHQLNRAIGVIQDTTKDWPVALKRFGLDCRRYAAKFGWSEEYEDEAWGWGVTQAAREALRLKARHERILHPLHFVLTKMRSSLKRDDAGRLFIPRYRVEWRYGSGVTITYSDQPMKVKESF